jgi:hypothetical protein
MSPFQSLKIQFYDKSAQDKITVDIFAARIHQAALMELTI